MLKQYEDAKEKLYDFYMLYSSDDILRFFILFTLGNLYENKITDYNKDEKSKIYLYFYNRLQKEGYYK